MINAMIQHQIEEFVGDYIVSNSSVSGGCIADSRLIEFKSGQLFFLKQGFSNSMFRCEANSLIELQKSCTLKVPEVILVEDEFLLLEYISQGAKKSDFFEIFGSQLAKLHQYQSDYFGFYEDNYIGASPQLNIATSNEAENWGAFYLNKRLLPQYETALRNGYLDKEFMTLFDKIQNLLPEILSGSDEPPSLLHGDLWSGNYMANNDGFPVLIDPAVYYGHREADLAMTLMFGGFPESFYAAYNDSYPLNDEYEYRQPIYLLYHVLNHLNLFGKSYYSQAKNLLKCYI